MKKSTAIILSSVILLCATVSCVYATTYTKFSSKFIKSFKDCDRYEETITSQFEDRTFTTTRKIQGWRNGFCQYTEVIKSPIDEYQLNCSLSSIQVDELYDAMKSRSKEPIKYEMDLFAEQKDPKSGNSKYVVVGTETIKGNKAYVTWAKYQNNPYFCSPKKIR